MLDTISARDSLAAYLAGAQSVFYLDSVAISVHDAARMRQGQRLIVTDQRHGRVIGTVGIGQPVPYLTAAAAIPAHHLGLAAFTWYAERIRFRRRPAADGPYLLGPDARAGFQALRLSGRRVWVLTFPLINYSMHGSRLAALLGVQLPDHVPVIA